MKTNTKLFFLFLFLIAIDQIIKNSSSFSVCNPNIAWSLSIAPAIFYFVWIIIIAALIYIFFKTKNYAQEIFLIFVLSGAVSNMIDRLRFGCVVDYIDLKFWPASIAMRSIAGWPVFNLADVYITIGVVLLVIASVAKQSRTS